MTSENKIQKYLVQGEGLLNDYNFLDNHKDVIEVARLYLEGKGVEENKELSYRLIDRILDSSRREFIHNKPSLYYEVAYLYAAAIEQCFNDDQNLYRALRFYLESKEALKDVAINEFTKALSFDIYFRIKDLKKRLKLKERKVKDVGYLLNNVDDYWSTSNIKISKEKDNLYLVTIVPVSQEFVLGVHEDIAYLERVRKIQYLLKTTDGSIDELLDKKINSIQIEDKTIDICLNNEEFLSFYNVDEVIYVPQNISSLDNKFTLIEALNNNKESVLYAIGKKINKTQVNKKVSKLNLDIDTIKDISYVYEDEVPLVAISL